MDIQNIRENVSSLIVWEIVENNQVKKYKAIRLTQFIKECVSFLFGGLAQLDRASALHAEGHRFESVILHQNN